MMGLSTTKVSAAVTITNQKMFYVMVMPERLASVSLANIYYYP